MGLSCGSQCAKATLFIFNFLFWLAGAGLLGLGIWFLVDSDALKYLNIAAVDSSDSLFRAAAITIIVVGAVVFVTGFLGCCGAIKESPCMLVTYAVILVILLLLQVTAGILAAVYRNQIQDELEKSMNKTINTYYGQANRTTETESFDFMQKSFKCCGVEDGPSDWLDTYWYRTKRNATWNQSVPDSCCVLLKSGDLANRDECNKAARGATNTTDTTRYLNTDPCSSALSEWINKHAGILIGAAFGVAAIQVFGIIFACCLKSSVHKAGYQYV